MVEIDDVPKKPDCLIEPVDKKKENRFGCESSGTGEKGVSRRV